MEFTREELQNIRARAREAEACPGLNVDWVSAYSNLAIAADHLDAMIARCTETKEPIKE